MVFYEEYHPYGTSSYRAADSSFDVSSKRYRYTGKERDDETGLYYHGARHYAPWLGRWTAADPIGLAGEGNRYSYAARNPVRFHDPTGGSFVPSKLEAAYKKKKASTPPPTKAKQEFIKRKEAQKALTNTFGSSETVKPTDEDIVEYADEKARAVDAIASSRGSDAFDKVAGSGDSSVRRGLAVVAGARAEVRTRLVGGLLTTGTRIASGVVQAPEKLGEAQETRDRANSSRLDPSVQTGLRFEALGQFADAGSPFFEALLIVVPEVLAGKAPPSKTGGGRGSTGQTGPKTDPDLVAGSETAETAEGAIRMKEQPFGVKVSSGGGSGPSLDVGNVLKNPESLWGFTAEEIATAFREAGFESTVVKSTRGSRRAEIVRISGHSEISQIQVHPGGGRHGGAYYKISSSTAGKIKVVDPDTYTPTPGEKATIIPFRGAP